MYVRLSSLTLLFCQARKPDVLSCRVIKALSLFLDLFSLRVLRASVVSSPTAP